MTISERVLELSQDKNFSQRDIATCIGVTQGTVQKWLSKNRPFSAEYILPLSELFGVSPLFLLTGKEEPAVANHPSKAPDEPVLSDDERYLLAAWREVEGDREARNLILGEASRQVLRVRKERDGTPE